MKNNRPLRKAIANFACFFVCKIFFLQWCGLVSDFDATHSLKQQKFICYFSFEFCFVFVVSFDWISKIRRNKVETIVLDGASHLYFASSISYEFIHRISYRSLLTSFARIFGYSGGFTDNRAEGCGCFVPNLIHVHTICTQRTHTQTNICKYAHSIIKWHIHAND